MVKKSEVLDKPFTEPGVVTLKNKEVIQLPRLTLGKIMHVTDSVNKLVDTAKEKTPQVFDILSGKMGEDVGGQLLQVLPTLLPYLLNNLVEVISKYLDKEEDWVKDNMDMEDLVAVATPFFADILVQGKHLFGPLTDALQKVK